MDLNELNPGIRKTVAWLVSQGFETCDSGDGETHEFECDQPQPYVTMLVPACLLVSEAKRLMYRLKTQHGIEVQTMDEEVTVPAIQAAYNPADVFPDSRDLGSITLWNVKL